MEMQKDISPERISKITYLGVLAAALVLGSLWGFCGGEREAEKKYRKQFSREEVVQKGYIAPKRIQKIFCRDLDGNGELETLIQIDDNQFLLMEVDNKPVISSYEIKPAEIHLK